jgi:hypothetical protein
LASISATREADIDPRKLDASPTEARAPIASLDDALSCDLIRTPHPPLVLRRRFGFSIWSFAFSASGQLSS